MAQTPPRRDDQPELLQIPDLTRKGHARETTGEITDDGPNGVGSTAAERQELYLPISGFVWLYPEELAVVDHPTFQRLGRIYQTGQAYLVYRGATHKRLEHSIGTLHVVHRMINAVKYTSARSKKTGGRAGAHLTEKEDRFTRLGALLHDIGHIAAGHTVEDELHLVGKHDQDQRLNLIFHSKDWADRGGRTLSDLINELYSASVPEDLRDSITASELVHLLIRKPSADKNTNKGDEDVLTKKHKILEKADSFRLNICRDLIGNTICADLLDYLHRDWYHIGKPHPFDERILQYMEIRAPEPLVTGIDPTPRAGDRFVISLGIRPKIRGDAVSAILDLLESRYRLAESVLFHRTKLSAAAMLDRALFELWGDDPQMVERTLLPLSDEQMLARCRELAGEKKTASAGVAEQLLSALEKRQLYCSLVTRLYDDLPPDVRKRVEERFGRTVGEPRMASRNRARVLQLLEMDFGLEAGSLAMYCPVAGMNAKIANVQIAVDDEVGAFAEYERSNDSRLSGGHLDAQLQRFDRLWRVHFFIDRKTKETIAPILPILQDAIVKLVLGNVAEVDPIRTSQYLARALAATPGSPCYGMKVLEAGVVGAYRDAETARGNYPFGAPSIKSFLE